MQGRSCLRYLHLQTEQMKELAFVYHEVEFLVLPLTKQITSSDLLPYHLHIRRQESSVLLCLVALGQRQSCS
jgi:hypothetical protein